VYNNGVEVLVTTLRKDPDSNNTGTYQTDIYFDVDGKDKGPNCLYNSVSCKEPDTFKLIIGADGTVVPGDAYGYEYRKKHSSWKKQEMVIGVLPEFDNKFKVLNYCDKYPNDLKCDPCQGKTSGSVYVDGKLILCGPAKPPVKDPVGGWEIIPGTEQKPVEPDDPCPFPHEYKNRVAGRTISMTCVIDCESQWGAFYHHMFINNNDTFYCVSDECAQKNNIDASGKINHCQSTEVSKYSTNVEGVLPAVYTPGMSLDPAFYWNGGGQDLGNVGIQTAPQF
jgi:hypothetical protein